MEHALKLLEGAVGILLTCVVLSIAVTVTRAGTKFANTFIQSVSNKSTELSESAKTKYEGLEVSGSEVVAVIRRYQNENQIKVRRLESDGSRLTLLFNGVASVLNLPSDWNYINPNAKFTGAIERSANGAITGMVFTQTYIVDSSGGGGGGVEPPTPGTTPSPTTPSSTSMEQVILLVNQLMNTVNLQSSRLDSLAVSLSDLTRLYTESAGSSGGGGSSTVDPGAISTLQIQLDGITDQLLQVISVLADLQAIIQSGSSDDDSGGSGLPSPSLPELSSTQLDDLATLQGVMDTITEEVANLTKSGMVTTPEDEEALSELSTTLTAVKQEIETIQRYQDSTVLDNREDYDTRYE